MSMYDIISEATKQANIDDSIVPLQRLMEKKLVYKRPDGLYSRREMMYRFVVQMRDFVDGFMVYLYLGTDERWVPPFDPNMLVYKGKATAPEIPISGIHVVSLLEVAVYNGLAPAESW